MLEVFAKSPDYSYNIQQICIISLICVFLCFYLNIVWQKRDMIIKSWNFPGPLHVAIFGIAYQFMTRPDDIIQIIAELQSKYPGGAKLWFGSKLLYMLHEPEHIEKVLASNRLVQKAASLYKPISDSIGDGLLTAPAQKWKRHRRHILPCFNQKILESFVVIFAEHTSVLNNVLAKNCGQEIDLERITFKCMLDIVLETFMSVKLDIQNTDSEYPYIIDRGMSLLFKRLFYVWYHIDFIWKYFGDDKETKEVLGKYNSLIDLVIEERTKALKAKKSKSSSDVIKEDPFKRFSFLDHILESEQFDAQELRDEISIFMIAGSDTTNITLCSVLTMLGMHPEVQQKVYEEVIGIMGNDRLPEYFDLPHMEYTERVIKETLRLLPSSAFFLRDMTEDVDMGDFVIPKGSSTFFGPLFIHRNPKYWPNPLKFDPDRFLAEEVAKRPSCAYIAFSYGPRNCIGMKYGMMSLKTTIANVIRKFEIHCGHKNVEDLRLKSHIIARLQGGYKVSFSPRKRT